VTGRLGSLEAEQKPLQLAGGWEKTGQNRPQERQLSVYGGLPYTGLGRRLFGGRLDSLGADLQPVGPAKIAAPADKF
jgi:hypothetical protein